MVDMYQQIQRIAELDLSYLIPRLIKKMKWDESFAIETVNKYKKFLILRYLYPDHPSVPTNEIDEVWHDHILHTKKYIRDCNELFGKYLHHHPSTETAEENEELEALFKKTSLLYEKEFQESYGYTFDVSHWIED